MGGGTIGANTQTISKAKYEADRRARQYKREKIDPQTEAAQRSIGETSSSGMKSFEMAVEGVQDFVERNTRSLMPQDQDKDQTSDTVSANYSKSSSEKSSKTDKKGQKESKGGTGGSKRQFYA